MACINNQLMLFALLHSLKTALKKLHIETFGDATKADKNYTK